MKSKPAILATRPINTPLGVFTAHYSAAGLARLDFPRGPVAGMSITNDKSSIANSQFKPGPSVAPALRGDIAPARQSAVPPPIRRWHIQAGRAVARILQGRDTGELPPLDLSSGSPFQRNVWTALRQIPAGQTETYGHIATALGSPKAARAVGGACGANPIPLLIPCHRVLASSGCLGGFSVGLAWKRILLARDAAPIPAATPRQAVRASFASRSANSPPATPPLHSPGQF
jgi:O-6-methylguanine DNA methyltransferase